MREYLDMWKYGLQFRGCTDRRGYWVAVLVNFIIFALLAFLMDQAEPFSYLFFIYYYISLLPGLTLTVRRLRDSGHSWAWLFLALTRIGIIVIIVFLASASKPFGKIPLQPINYEKYNNKEEP